MQLFHNSRCRNWIEVVRTVPAAVEVLAATQEEYRACLCHPIRVDVEQYIPMYLYGENMYTYKVQFQFKDMTMARHTDYIEAISKMFT